MNFEYTAGTKQSIVQKLYPVLIFLCSLIVCDRDKKFFNKKNENNETWKGKITKNLHKNKPFTQIEANITNYQHTHILK